MKTLRLMIALLVLAISMMAQQKTMCTGFRVYILDQEVPMPEVARMLDQSIAALGYRPAPRMLAQVRLAFEMRVHLDPRLPDGDPTMAVAITGMSGSRVHRWRSEFTAADWESRRDHIQGLLAVGLLTVMENIEPGFTSKLMEAEK